MDGEFWAAIAGAFVGGVIALAIQMLAIKAATRERNKDLLQRQQVLGHSLLFKMMAIQSHLYHFSTYLEGCFEKAENDNLKGRHGRSLCRSLICLAR